MATQPSRSPTTLLKFLQQRGVDSRRRILDAIVAGHVTVNGAVVRDSGYTVLEGRDRVAYAGAAPGQATRPVYLMMHKPKGVITTTKDERGRTTVFDLLPAPLRAERLFPVGRLDADTEGLLLLTNDGDLTQRLTHPSYEVEKEYEVTLDRPLASHEAIRLRAGIRLDDGMTAPARVRSLGGSTYALVIHEGKKRQVRRMFQALGYHVTRLRRVRVKDLHLGQLAPGDTRPLTPRELRSLTS